MNGGYRLKVSVLVLMVGMTVLGQDKTSIIYSPGNEQVSDISGVNPAEVFTIGYLKKSFIQLNVKDVLSGTNLITKKLVDLTGLRMYSETALYDSIESVIRDLEDSKLDAVALLADELLYVRTRVAIDPFVVAARNGHVYDEYLLLVKKGRALDSLSLLRDKELLFAGEQEGALPLIWLDRQLQNNGLPRAAGLFGRIRTVGDVSKAVLPVFFGQSDACLVSKRSFDIMVELNPQVGTVLAELLHSPPFVNGTICIRGSLSEAEHRDVLEKSLLELSHEPLGRQILAIFQINELVPFREEYLQSAKVLLKDMEPERARGAGREKELSSVSDPVGFSGKPNKP